MPIINPPVSNATPSFTTPATAIVTNGGTTFNHGLGAVPKNFTLKLVCVTAEGDYAVGDTIIVPTGYGYNGTQVFGISIYVNAGNTTQFVVKINAGANGIFYIRKTTGAGFALTNANWQYIVEASL